MKLTRLGKELSSQFELYKENHETGVPVLAMMYEEDKQKFSNYFWNKTQNSGKSHMDSHAEMLLLKKINVEKYECVDIIITLSPCFECLCELYKSNRVRNIFFIFNKTWTRNQDEEIVKKIIKDSKGKIKNIKFPKNMSKKSFVGIHQWGEEITIHLNTTKRMKKRGKLFYDESNNSISLN